ncbi:hypothetical protein JVT61DRAFT_10333 [Boletus reticuloceps]|uniref:Uncharacterized protein n=1 Tax=Boletus reticuloceps TaxID=495285 RepID=A0A8I3ADU4_9AGAM|nr:hypothetical protein JVT61DRAFT_10333 [Boletus reticuloceps]
MDMSVIPENPNYSDVIDQEKPKCTADNPAGSDKLEEEGIECLEGVEQDPGSQLTKSDTRFATQFEVESQDGAELEEPTIGTTGFIESLESPKQTLQMDAARAPGGQKICAGKKRSKLSLPIALDEDFPFVLTEEECCQVIRPSAISASVNTDIYMKVVFHIDMVKVPGQNARSSAPIGK